MSRGIEISRLVGLKRQAQRAGWGQWIRSVQDEAAILDGCYFDEVAAQKPVNFFRDYLVQTKTKEWSGKPFELLPWQRDEIVMPLFGWKRESGNRRYREAYIEIPKKNGKSTLCAGLELFLLCADGEPGAEVYTVAVDRTQARIVHNEAANMVRRSPLLSEFLKPIDTTTTIKLGTECWIRALSADVPTKEGINPHALICDELHAWRDRKMFDTLEEAGIARSNFLWITITTAGTDLEGVCGEKHFYALDVLSGKIINWTFLPLIYAADPDDDIHSPETWRQANPSYGVVLPPERFAESLAKATTPHKIANFKRYRLNIWGGAEDPWIDSDAWDACHVDDIDEDELEGLPCWGGLDLGSTKDTTAWVLVFPREGGRYTILPRIFVPEVQVEKAVTAGVGKYDEWVQAGDLIALPGEVTDEDAILERVFDDAERFKLQSIRFDAWGSRNIVKRLDDKGLRVIPLRQGFKSMTAPIHELEKLYQDGMLEHCNACLDWQMEQVVAVEGGADEIKFTKRTRQRGKRKIDAAVALVMALDGAVFGDPEPEETDHVFTRDSLFFLDT